ncbi:MAG: FlgO family outer membrane protein [Candidatus Marinimicrobia bacterium]|nr:FlgO family outer membrane protein [Candidatus Neomarinimicrobiota bacterium]
MNFKKLFVFIIIIQFFIFGCMSSETTVKESPKTLDSQLEILVAQIVNSLSENNKVKIGVMQFTDLQGNASNLGKYIAEELTTRLYLTKRFDVVERQMMDKILEEQNLSLHGYIDIDSKVGVGKVLGVDAIVSGSITDLGEYIKINARLISPEDGKVFSVASVKILKDGVINKLMGQSIETKKTGKPITKDQPPIHVEKEPIVKEPIVIVGKNGLKYEIIGANMINRIVTVKIKIMNTTEDDIEFGMYVGWPAAYTTMMYDNSGNEYVVSGVKLGNKFSSLKNAVSQYAGAGKKIIAGISVDMEIQFEKVSSEITKITLLQINAGRGNMLEFRNIPVEK